MLTGQKADISSLLNYTFYQEIFFKDYETEFPAESQEKLGYWVGIEENVGDALTYKI